MVRCGGLHAGYALHVECVDVSAAALKQPEWQLSGFGQLKFNIQGSLRTVTQFRLLPT